MENKPDRKKSPSKETLSKYQQTRFTKKPIQQASKAAAAGKASAGDRELK